jgi:hypothetical protein
MSTPRITRKLLNMMESIYKKATWQRHNRNNKGRRECNEMRLSAKRCQVLPATTEATQKE